MKKKILFGLLLIIINNSCAQENKNEITIKKQEKNMNIENILKLQLLSGKSGLFDDTADGETYFFEEKDLEATIPLIDSTLKSSGFKFLTNDLFNKKINSIFGRTIDVKSPSKYLYFTTSDNCDRNLVFYTNDQTVQINPPSYYIIKDHNFITELYAIPQITDYQKNYPNIASVEKNVKTDIIRNDTKIHLYLWREFEQEKEPSYNLKANRKKNIQTIIARNMYLFNDSRAQFKWLILNDQYFMESLVKIFGYTDDRELLQWVIEKTKFDKNNPDDYGKLFWMKQCDGTLKIHANTFKVLQKLYTPEIANQMSNDIRFTLNNIKDYSEYLASQKSNKLTKTEKIKVIGNIVYFAEQYKYDKRFLSGLGDNSKMMGQLRNLLSKEDIDILKNNNYFNLPKFKEWWENADYDEYISDPNQVWGRDNEPMTIGEWRKQN